MMRFTLDQKRKEIERELKMRRTTYRKWVHEGRMSPAEASDRIKILEAILDDYNEIHEPRFPDSY